MVKINSFILDPFNNNQIELLKEFEKENNIINKESEYLEQIQKEFTKEEYQKTLNSNEKSILLCIKEKNKIIDYCNIKMEKDRKICFVTYPTLTKKKRKIFEYSTMFIFNELDINEMFVNVNENDKLLKDELVLNKFESLGEIKDNNIIFMKEKEFDNKMERDNIWK